MRITRYGLVPAAIGVALLVSACGGGGSGGTTTANSPTPTALQADVPVTVVDGAINKAKVCLDQNTNNACDPGEPTAITDATGKATLKVDQADVGKYPIIAEVGTDAVDAVSGQVPTAYVMKAPADQTSVVSPLTTLVQNTVAVTGVTSAAAEASLRVQVGVNTSLFTDFTQGSDADSTKMGTLARLVVTSAQTASQQLASAVGTQALDGKAIQAADVQQVIQQKLLTVLPTLVADLGDSRLTGATPAQVGSVISTLAQELVASPSTGLTTSTLATLVAVARGTDTTPDSTSTSAITAGATLAALNYTDANTWYRRVFTASAAQNMPDANGIVRYTERRNRSTLGAVAVWGAGGDPTRQSDVHWNGSAWTNCPLNFDNTQTVRDAQGRSQYNYCDSYEKGVSIRTAIDLSGRAMADVYQQFVAAGMPNLSINNAPTALGTATFPTGSKVYYQTSTALATAPVYIPNLGSDEYDANSGVASGDPTACAQITASTPGSSYTTLTTSITGFVAARAGTPCVYQPGSIVITTTSGTTTVSSGPRNEWWSQSTADVGTIGNAPYGASTIQTGYYTSNTPLRVAFGANQATTYYACQQRASDGSIRNCNQIGTGTYTVATLGDAKVLTLQNEPAQFSSLSYSRIFVERGGKVHAGYVNHAGTRNEARLNLTALNALSTQLGIPTVDPETVQAKTVGTYSGFWLFSQTQPLNVYSGVAVAPYINGNGASCNSVASNGGYSAFPCTVTLVPSTGALTGSDSQGGVMNLVLDSNTGIASGTVTPPGGTPVTFFGMRR